MRKQTMKLDIRGLASNRQVSPLRPAKDAIIIDSTGRSVEQIVEQILALVNEQVEHGN